MSSVNFRNNPLNLIIKEPNWKRLIQKLDMAYYHCRMPVLENVNIALSEVLEVRGSPLREEELWALLGQSISAIEDLFLTGNAHKNGVPELTITPSTLQCTAMGRIVICQATEAESEICLYKAPEIASIETSEVDNPVSEDIEKSYVYSLGKTIWFAANYDPNATDNNYLQDPELTSVSPMLCVLVENMIENDIAKRMSFPDLVRACLTNVPLFTKQVPTRKIVVTLHEQVLGSLPEGEILRQVEQNVAIENQEFDFEEISTENDGNAVASLANRRQSCVFVPKPSSTEFIYGHRFEYSFKENLVSVDAESNTTSRTASPRERWKNAFAKVSENRRQELLANSRRKPSDNSKRWENYKAKDSIEKVCEELTERRKMLQLLRMNINLAPTVNVDVISNTNFSKGIKPKTLAELVLLLKKPKLIRGSSSSSLGSSGSIRSAMAMVGHNAVAAAATSSHTPEKISFNVPSKHHASTSLLKNVVTTNLKKSMNSSYYSTFDSELLTQNCNQYCWNPSAYSYYGPEFVIRSTLSPVKMCLSSPAQERTNSVPLKATVILLSGQQLVVTSNANISGRQLFHSIAHQVALPEPNIFGLAIRKGDEFLFIDTKQKLNKMKPFLNAAMELVTLYLRVKYFLPDISFLSNQSLKHLYYLELRRNILERRTVCSYEKALSLAALALQAEFGDYNRKRFGSGDYFLLEHYIPEYAINFCDREETKMQLFQMHLENTGKSVEEAENDFIQISMDLPEYGYHFYSVLQDKSDSSSKVWVSISAWGVDVFEDQNEQRSMCQSYCWSNIRQISFSKRYFTLVPKSQSLTGKPVKYMFFIGDYLKSSSLFSMAVGHHRFFVKQKIEKSLSITSSMEELDLIPFSSITNYNENAASEDEDIEYKINPDSINNDYQDNNPKSWISKFTNKYFEGVRNSSPKKYVKHKLTKAHSTSEVEPIDSVRKEFGISIKPLPPAPPLFAYHSSLKERPFSPPRDQQTQSYDDAYEVLLLRSELVENGLGLTLTCGSDEATLLSGTFVESVLTDGPCYRKINQGDRVIAVNGERLEEKNYLEVVDIIREIKGDILLTLLPALSTKNDRNDSPVEMPTRLQELGDTSPETKVQEKNFYNDDSRRNSSALDCNGYRSLNKNDIEINNNNNEDEYPTVPVESPAVPARRRRKNTRDSSLSSNGGETENNSTTNAGTTSIDGIPPDVGFTPSAAGRNGSGDGNHQALTFSARPTLDRDDNDSTTTEVRDDLTSLQEEMGTRKDSNVDVVKRRRTSTDKGDPEERPGSGTDVFGQGHLYQVTLQKINDSFGFRVAERYQLADGFRRGIFVHSLIPKGAAEFNGKIKPGDQLISLNEISTENLSYKEGVNLLKKSPDTATLCFERFSQSRDTSGLEDTTSSNEDAENMIAKWGRRGSRTSLASQTNSGSSSPSTAVRSLTTPTYARSISQVILPTVEELRALAEKEDTEPHSSSKSDDKMGYLSNQGTERVDATSIIGNGNAHSSHVSKNASNSIAFNGLVPPSTYLNNSAGSDSDASKELLELVPEDYSLNSFDSVFYSGSYVNKSLDETICSSSAAAKYLATQEDSSQDRQLACDTSIDDTGCDSSGQLECEPKPTPRRRKKKGALIEKPQDILNFVNEGNCFQVSVRKSSRGLGLAIFGGVDMRRLGPICQLIRIRKLYPLQPAVACGQLNVGDVILEVNGLNMIGLTNTEALETLRVASNEVVLKIFRPDPSLMPPVSFFIQDLSPDSSALISPTGSASNTLKRPSTLNYGSNNANTYIDTTLVKVEGTLGFSIFRYENLSENDNHPTGIYVKALIREPAISNGQIQAGDQVLQVNGEDVSGLSRAEAVTLLRNSGNSVTLKLYRFNEPLSPCSLDEIPHSKPLRIEARELLSDKAARRKSDGNSTSPRRLREKAPGLKRESVSSASSADSKGSVDLPPTLSVSPSTPNEIFPAALGDKTDDLDVESDNGDMDLSMGLNRNSRPKSLDLLCINEKKQQNSVRSSQTEVQDGNQLFHRQASVVVPNCNDNSNEKQQIDEKGEGLLKWRGATLLSNEENVARLNLSLSTLSSGCQSPPLSDQSRNGSNGELNSPPDPPRRLTSLQSWDSTPEETEEFLSSGQKLRKLYVQLDRGWQSRLGFSLGDQLPSNATCASPQVSSPVVTVVHSGSLAHKDGRISVGDRLIEVNGESLLEKTAAEVIDLLRKTRGKVHIVLLRLSNDNKEPLI